MENMQEKCFTLEDKAKFFSITQLMRPPKLMARGKEESTKDDMQLKERLALLKKEYKKTVNRLQKSERAERVKTYVKRTIEEQNRLLSQEYTGQDSVLLSAGPENCTSNASGDFGESHKIFETPSADKERKPCVSFNLEPEIVNSDSRTPSCSGGESSGQEAEGNRALQSSQISRSRLRLSRTARRVCFSESPSPSVCRISSIVNVLDGKERTVDKSLSPVFKKHPTDGAPLRPDNPAASYCSEDSKPKENSHEIAGPSSTALLRLGTADNSPGEVRSNFESLHSVDEIATPNEQLFVKNSFVKSETKEEHPLPTSQSLDVDVTCISSCGPLDTPPRALEFENHTDLKRTSQVSPPLSSENQPPLNLKVHTESTVVKEDHNPLSSCTLVEGLLFPVEYYVRTTRRMTSCQRKVDLEAVISSHLLTGRKGSRGRSRRNSTSLSTPVNPSDRLSNSLTPSSHPSVSNSAGEVTRSRRGRGRKSCPAALSSGLKDVSVQLRFDAENSPTLSGSQSEKENCEEAMASNESHGAVKCLTNIRDGSQIKEVDRFMTLLSDKKAYSLRSRDTVFNVSTSAGYKDGKLYNFGSSKEVGELTGSPFPVFSDRISLDRLSHYFKITDFHLPDEDFGILKLEKLKSVNHLEPFTPHTPRDGRGCNQHPKIDSKTLPTTSSSAVLQEENLVACSQNLHRAINLIESSENCLNVDPTPCNKEGPLENNKKPSADAAEPSHSLISEPTSALPPVVPVLDSKDKISQSPKKYFLLSPFPYDNNPRHISCIPERPLPDDEIPQNTLPMPSDSSSDGDIRTLIAVTEVSGDAESLWANLDSQRIKESDDVPRDSPTQSKISGTLASPKELNSSVLFSTSLCSVPQENMNDFVSSSCTPGLPFLGSTPAIFSSLQGSNTSVACSPGDEGQEKVLLPEVCGGEGREFMSLSCISATGDTEDTKQCHDVLGQDNTTVVESHCEYLEHQENSLLSKTDKDRSVHVISENADNEDTGVETGSGVHLHLLSEVKDSCGGGCAVDLCPVWWEFSGSPELCIVAASESSVCLWRPQTEGNWDCAHSWCFKEMPVIQILPLSQEKNIVCVALGNLETMEIWALFSPPKTLGWKKQLVKRGHMKTAQGLSRHRLVSSGSGEHDQVVEVQQLSETGSTVQFISLVPPKDSVVAFCEVEGERDALVGSTMDTYVVVWNAVTGHLLSTIRVGDHCSDLTCLSATSDSGLLFLVVASLFSKPCEDAGSCIFKLIAANPREGTSTPIISYVIPDKPSRRYLEGDVKRQKAAAVLTCGSIALWDLSRSHCSVTLPPSLDAPWCLVRWSHIPCCLLTGRKDGTICIYEYTEHCSDKER